MFVLIKVYLLIIIRIISNSCDLTFIENYVNIWLVLWLTYGRNTIKWYLYYNYCVLLSTCLILYLKNLVSEKKWNRYCFWKYSVISITSNVKDNYFIVAAIILEKEMATHSSVLAWRIPGTGGPGGLSSLGSHRVGHDWSDLAAIYLLICAKQCSRYFICIVLLLNLKTVFHSLSKGSEQEGILEKFKRNTFFFF